MSTLATTDSGLDPQSIRRLLQINICVLLSASGVTFATAEGHPLGMLSVPIAILGLLLTDWSDRFSISARGANLLGVVAFMAAGVEYFGESLEAQLLSFGHLLLYLSWVLLLQPKQTTRVWWLCVISVLQVAIASILTNGSWFPIAAMSYMMMGIWTLSVFSLHRAVARSAAIERSASPATNGDLRASVDPADMAKAAGVGLTASRSRNTIRLEGTSRWITPRFIMGILACGALSILLGVSIFVLTPRIWIGRLRLFEQSLSREVQPLTGFTEEVTLGDIGEILENPNLVLEASFSDTQTGEPIDVEALSASLGYDAPFFRGEVLERYKNGRWSSSPLEARRGRRSLSSATGPVRQEIHLQPIGTQTLFVADRAIRCTSEQELDIFADELRDTFTATTSRRRRRPQPETTVYSAYSGTADEPLNLRRSTRFRSSREAYEAETLRFPSQLTRLQELTDSLSAQEDSETPTDRELTRLLVAHLRDSGRYLYTLSVSIDDPLIDPVEDFLFNRRRGHCEYFASALALMLRSAGIPSRLVSGFKGGELNEETGLYEVRQLHAHAWVEAFVDDQWILLDPTPAARDASVAGMSTTVNPWERLRETAEKVWMRGLFMNQTQQQAEIYRPLGMFFREKLESVRQVGLVQATADWFRELGKHPRKWISGWGFITAFLLGVIISAIVWGLRKLWTLLRRITVSRRRGGRQQRQIIAFYDRFRRLVAMQGHVRAATLTQREFAGAIEWNWRQSEDLATHDGLARLPTRLTEAFYRVRFGEQSLSEDELQQINASLDRLEQQIRRMSGRSEDI